MLSEMQIQLLDILNTESEPLRSQRE